MSDAEAVKLVRDWLDSKEGTVDTKAIRRVCHIAHRATQSETKEPTREWLIWSNEHRAWWGPNNAGYPKDVHKAGRYTLAEARSICSSRSWDAHGVPPETMIHEIEATRV